MFFVKKKNSRNVQSKNKQSKIISWDILPEITKFSLQRQVIQPDILLTKSDFRNKKVSKFPS